MAVGHSSAGKKGIVRQEKGATENKSSEGKWKKYGGVFATTTIRLKN